MTEQLDSLDTPISIPKWLGKKKFKLVIINEDNSPNEYFLGFPSNGFFQIKNKYYHLVPRAIIRGKYPTLYYYFNNPCPILFQHEASKVTAYDLRSEDQRKLLSEEDKLVLINIVMDAESMNIAFTTRVVQGLYSHPGITGKTIVIILVVVAALILIFLQVFGVIDIFSLFGGAKT